MARGVPLTVEQQTALRAAWDQSGRYDVAALAVGCSTASARRYLRGVPVPTVVATAATIKTAEDIAEAILTMVGPLVSHMTKPEVIASANLKETATAFGIIIDKFQLLTGQATARTETGPTDPGRLTPEEREVAARIREKLAAEVMK